MNLKSSPQQLIRYALMVSIITLGLISFQNCSPADPAMLGHQAIEPQPPPANP